MVACHTRDPGSNPVGPEIKIFLHRAGGQGTLLCIKRNIGYLYRPILSPEVNASVFRMNGPIPSADFGYLRGLRLSARRSCR